MSFTVTTPGIGLMPATGTIEKSVFCSMCNHDPCGCRFNWQSIEMAMLSIFKPWNGCIDNPRLNSYGNLFSIPVKITIPCRSAEFWASSQGLEMVRGAAWAIKAYWFMILAKMGEHNYCFLREVYDRCPPPELKGRTTFIMGNEYKSPFRSVGKKYSHRLVPTVLFHHLNKTIMNYIAGVMKKVPFPEKSWFLDDFNGMSAFPEYEAPFRFAPTVQYAFPTPCPCEWREILFKDKGGLYFFDESMYLFTAPADEVEVAYATQSLPGYTSNSTPRIFQFLVKKAFFTPLFIIHRDFRVLCEGYDHNCVSICCDKNYSVIPLHPGSVVTIIIENEGRFKSVL